MEIELLALLASFSQNTEVGLYALLSIVSALLFLVARGLRQLRQEAIRYRILLQLLIEGGGTVPKVSREEIAKRFREAGVANGF